MKERTEEHNSTRGELEERGEQRRGLSYKKKKKRLSFTHERREKKRAKEKLLLASWTQCQTQSVSGLAALLVSQAPAHNGGEPRPPHLSLPICVLQDRPESKGAAGKGVQCTPNVQILIKNLRVVRIGLTSKSKRKKKKALPQVALDRFTLIRTANIGYFIVGEAGVSVA